MPTESSIGDRLRQVSSLPEALDAGFDAFEAIRLAARDWQDRAPRLFAAFMMTADAAVDGREALTAAPSLSLTGSAQPSHAALAGADAGQAADALAALAALVRDRLTEAIDLSATPEDRAACQEAAEAAERIRRLMTR